MTGNGVTLALLSVLLGLLPACGGGGGDGAMPGSGAAPGTFQVSSWVAGNGQAQLAWGASAGATGYSVSYGRQGGGFPTLALGSAISPAIVTGLNNGFAYALTVTASNAQGSTQALAAGPVTPMYAPSFRYTCVRNFYVATSGNDANDGTSVAQAQASVGRAVARADLQAGDCVNVLPGTYTEAVSLGQGGSNASATGHVVLRSTVPLGARLLPPAGAYSTIDMNANYIVVDGFDVTGGAGSAIDGCVNDTPGRHHLVALNNLAHDAGLSGISMCAGDYFHVEGNITARNAATSLYQGSGISIYEPRAIADAAPGFHIVVRNNVSYGNVVRFACDHCHTDGNGIILDDFRNTQLTSGPWAGVAYPYASLVENNLVFGNGGAGVASYLSDHATLRNNTAYFNNQDTNFARDALRGEIGNADSSDNSWVNNIGVADPATDAHNFALLDTATGVPNANVVWANNLAWAGGSSANLVTLFNSSTAITAAGGNLLGTDPKFVVAATDPAVADFRLQPASPAIASGLASSNADTLNGLPRSASAPDRGAY